MIKRSETEASLKDTANGIVSLFVWKSACKVISNELLLRSTSVSKGKNVLLHVLYVGTDEIIKINTIEIRGCSTKMTKGTKGWRAFMLIKWWTYTEETDC